MPLSRRFGIVLLGSLAAGLIAARPTERVRAREIARIQQHFDSVLVELGQRDTRSLSKSAASNRAELVAELHRYRDQGAFPHNYDFPGEAVPYFVDRETGVLCAVAN